MDTILPDTALPGQQSILQSLLSQASELAAGGMSQSEIFAHILNANARSPQAIPGDQLADAVIAALRAGASKNPPGVSQDVTQANPAPGDVTHETQETQDYSGKLIETHRNTTRAPTGTEIPKCPPREGTSLTLPWIDYLAKAIEEYCNYLREQSPPEWQWPFAFVRLIRAHATMANKSAAQGFRMVDQEFSRWRRSLNERQRNCDPWERLIYVPRDDAEAAFLDCWDKVRNLPGIDHPLENAMELARRTPLSIRNAYPDRPSGYEVFISLAGWLQWSMSDRSIMLPVHDVAKLLEVRPMTVSRYRRWAKEDGFLQELQESEYHGKGGSGKATEFRFNLGRFPVLSEAAQ